MLDLEQGLEVTEERHAEKAREVVDLRRQLRALQVALGLGLGTLAQKQTWGCGKKHCRQGGNRYSGTLAVVKHCFLCFLEFAAFCVVFTSAQGHGPGQAACVPSSALHGFEVVLLP